MSSRKRFVNYLTVNLSRVHSGFIILLQLLVEKSPIFVLFCFCLQLSARDAHICGGIEINKNINKQSQQKTGVNYFSNGSF